MNHFCSSMAKLKIGQMRNPRAKKTSTLVAKYFEKATASMERWQHYVASKTMPPEADLPDLFGNDIDFVMSFKGVSFACRMVICKGIAVAYARYMWLICTISCHLTSKLIAHECLYAAFNQSMHLERRFSIGFRLLAIFQV